MGCTKTGAGLDLANGHGLLTPAVIQARHQALTSAPHLLQKPVLLILLPKCTLSVLVVIACIPADTTSHLKPQTSS